MVDCPSNAAKAASILHHTWGVPDFDTALKIYEALSDTHGSVSDVLALYNAGVWDAVAQLSDGDWWENVECLALSIDKAHSHYADEQANKGETNA